MEFFAACALMLLCGFGGALVAAHDAVARGGPAALAPISIRLIGSIGLVATLSAAQSWPTIRFTRLPVIIATPDEDRSAVLLLAPSRR